MKPIPYFQVRDTVDQLRNKIYDDLYHGRCEAVVDGKKIVILVAHVESDGFVVGKSYQPLSTAVGDTLEYRESGND